MNASLPAGQSGLTGAREVVNAAVDAPEFAREAAREYRESPEVAQTRAGTVVEFLSESLRKLKDEGVMKMFTYWIEELAGALNLSEKLNSLVKLTQDSFLGKLFGLGEILESGLDKIHGQTVLGVLTVAFGALLGKEALGSLAGALEGKVGLEELLQAKEAPGGLAAFLLAKAKAGLEIPRAVWDEIRGPLGLPEWSALGAVVESATDSVRVFDEQSGLKALRERMGGYFDVQFPSWRDNEAMAWVRDLENPAQIAASLGIDLKNPSTWESALRVGAEGVGLAGGYLLLRRFLGANSPLPHAIVFNVAIYRFFASEGMDTLMLHGFDVVRELETTACATINGHIDGFLGQYNLKPADLGIHFKNGSTFGLADGMEWIWEHAHDNPAVSLLAVNAVTFHDWALLRFMKRFMVFLLEGSWKTTQWAVEHKEAALALVAFGTVGYIKKREVVEDFATLIYPGNSEKREAFLQSAEDVLDLRLGEAETFAEEVVDPVYERLMADPLEFLSSGELKLQLFNDMADGKVLWRIGPSVESVALGIVVNGNPIWHAINFELGVLESLLSEFCDTQNPGEEFNVWAVPVLGLEGYVVGRAAQGSYKGYVALFDSTVNGVGRVNRLFMSIIPFTRANRHLWWSSLRQIGDSFPVVNATEIINGLKVSRVTYYAHELMDSVQRGDRRAVSDRLQLIRNEMPALDREAYQYLDDIEIQRSLRTIEEISGELNTKMLGSEDTTRLKERLRLELQRVESRYSRLLNLGRYLREGNVRLAVQTIRNGGIEALSARTIFEGKTDAVIRGEAEALERELAALSPDDVTRSEKLRQLRIRQAYLDPRNLAGLQVDPRRFESVDHDRRALRLREMSGEMEAFERGVSARVTSQVEAIQELARSRGVPMSDPDIQLRLLEVQDHVLTPFWKQKKLYLAEIHRQYRGLPAHFRTSDLRRSLALAQENTYLSKVVQGAKGRAVVVGVMLPLMFTMDYLAGRDEAERDFYEILKGLGPDAGQLIIDVLPGIGTYSNYHTAITGEELYTGRQLEGWARHSNWLWGTVGLAADALTVLTFLPSGSSSVAGNGAARLALLAARGSRTAERLRTAWPTIAKIADRMGGFENLVQSTMRYMNAAQDTRLAKGLRLVQSGGLAVGATITVGQMAGNLIYAAEDGDEGFEVSPDFLPTEETGSPDSFEVSPDSTPHSAESIEFQGPMAP